MAVAEKPDSSDDDIDQLEKDRRDDLGERDAFAKRMLEKDKEKTRQIMSKTEKKVRARQQLSSFFFLNILYCASYGWFM